MEVKVNRKIVFIPCFIILFCAMSCGSKSKAPVDNFPYTERVEPTRAELVMSALLEAYPEQIEKVEFRNDDWAALIKDTWFYYAGGRLLPESELENIDIYRTHQFYNYPEDLPSWERSRSEEVRRFRNWTNNRSQNQIRRSNLFLDSIWSGSTRVEIENNLARVSFLERNIRVHKLVENQLMLVEQRILAAAETDAEVKSWIDEIGTLDAYNWRNIADTQSRSYHSYGIAIDILPRALAGRHTYWLWTIERREDWWNVPYSERYHPPNAVIKAFEYYGFIWGGKWPLFDTMHFEYRPEILLLNGMSVNRE